MSNYFIQCCKDHAANMKARESMLLDDIRMLKERHETLMNERINLENGVDNWISEEDDQ